MKFGNKLDCLGRFFKEKLRILLNEKRNFEKVILGLKGELEAFKTANENLRQEAAENSLQPTGSIIMSLISQIKDAQEIDICAGTSTVLGYFTAKFCCQADQKYLFDSKTHEQLTFDENSIWIEENICLINTTEISRITVPSFDFQGKERCSIVTFDELEGKFNEYQLDLEINKCFNTSCSLTIDDNMFHNETILNGTSVLCRQANHFGIVTKGKFQLIFVCFKNWSDKME